MRKALARLACIVTGLLLVVSHWSSGNAGDPEWIARDIMADLPVLCPLALLLLAAMLWNRTAKVVVLAYGVGALAVVLGDDVMALREAPWTVVSYNPMLWGGLAVLVLGGAIGILPPRSAREQLHAA